jgi:hypothetical protein
LENPVGLIDNIEFESMVIIKKSEKYETISRHVKLIPKIKFPCLKIVLLDCFSTSEVPDISSE